MLTGTRLEFEGRTRTTQQRTVGGNIWTFDKPSWKAENNLYKLIAWQAGGRKQSHGTRWPTWPGLPPSGSTSMRSTSPTSATPTCSLPSSSSTDMSPASGWNMPGKAKKECHQTNQAESFFEQTLLCSGGFCYLRQELDSSDIVAFPEEIFGKAR